mgnify:CR=1 FL=1
MARTNRPDEAYHIPTLNFWFAISSILLMITSVWMVWFDYDRSWKNVQRDFQRIERDRLEYEKAQAQEEIQKEEFAKLEATLEKAEADVVAQQAAVESSKQELKTQNDVYYLARQSYQFKKADLAEKRYVLEHDLGHAQTPVEVKKLKEVYALEDQAVLDLEKEFKVEEEKLYFAQTKLDKLLGANKAAQAALDAAQKEVTAYDKRLDKIANNFFNDVFRDAPLLDFMAPSLRIKQRVIPDIRDDYNFATVQKEDRCETCHLGIANSSYDTDAQTGRFLTESTRAVFEHEVIDYTKDFIEEALSGDDAKYALEEIATLQEKPELSIEAWAEENIEDEARRGEFIEYLAEAREDLRKETAQFKAHPNLDLFLTSKSPHPVESYGCTVCHEGRGHAIDFDRVYHTPESEEEAARWTEDYGWHEPHYWDWPQFPAQYVEASCAKCHDAEVKIAGAEKYNKGRELVESAGCFGCHKIDGLTGVLRKVGPGLTKYPSKVADKDFAFQWIWNPKHFQPDTKMPQFFGLENNSPPEFKSLNEQEVRGIVAYLYKNSDSYTPEALNVSGNPQRGKQLFEEVGCLACHSMNEEKQSVADHGPDLSGIGSKLNQEWMYSWMRNPKGYFAKTHMPSLRLNKNEAADISAYLISLKKKDWNVAKMPARDEALQEELLRIALGNSMRRTELDNYLGELDAEERELQVGEKAIGKYGCTGCHDIKGFEKAGPSGTELTTWGSKLLNKLDFAMMHGEIPHTKIAWFQGKVDDPRVYDRGKVKAFPDLLKMPRFGFNEDEIEALTTYILSRVKNDISDLRKRKVDPDLAAIQEGRTMARELNCYGCHYFDGEGGDFALYWTVNDQGRGEFISSSGREHFDYLEHVPGPTRGHAPPLLLDQGNKTEPQWLFSFLKDPMMLRPQLKMRMPTFGFDDAEANTIIKMFAGIEGHDLGVLSSYQPDVSLALTGHELFQRGKCTQCHLFTDKVVSRENVPKTVVAPNLKLSAQRLQAQWIVRWLKDPQSIMPGANMPNYFDTENNFTVLDQDSKLLGGDMHKGMQALRDYLKLSGSSKSGGSERAGL